ncbi:MAG TPA: hypothetical protein VD757_01685 [Candidatus Nitrosocosmicus sp.]|nr:hypothetical protein [Candidatus Nitrosocosmicus sp.]
MNEKTTGNSAYPKRMLKRIRKLVIISNHVMMQTRLLNDLLRGDVFETW